jgi:hypothetical protein
MQYEGVTKTILLTWDIKGRESEYFDSSERACCNQVLPSAVARCARCRALAATTPAATSPARSKAVPCARKVCRTVATVPRTRRPKACVSPAADGFAVRAAPATGNCTFQLVVDRLPHHDPLSLMLDHIIFVCDHSPNRNFSFSAALLEGFNE